MITPHWSKAEQFIDIEDQLNAAYERGYDDGHSDGYSEGYDEGGKDAT